MDGWTLTQRANKPGRDAGFYVCRLYDDRKHLCLSYGSFSLHCSDAKGLLCLVLCCWIGWLINAGLSSSHILHFLQCQIYGPDCHKLQSHNTGSLMLLFPPVFQLGQLQITKCVQGLRPKAPIHLLYAIQLLFYSKNCVNSHRVIYPLPLSSDSNILLLLFVFLMTEFKVCPLFVP